MENSMKRYPEMSGDMRNAVIDCDADTVRALLDDGEDPRATDREGMNILDLAASDPQFGMAEKILGMVKNTEKEKEMLSHACRRGDAFSICLGREEELRADGVIGKAEHTKDFDAVDRARRLLGLDPEMHGVGLILYPEKGKPVPVFFSGRTENEAWKNKFHELVKSGCCIYEEFTEEDIRNGNFPAGRAAEARGLPQDAENIMYRRGDRLVCFDPVTGGEDSEEKLMAYSLSGDFSFRDAVTDIMDTGSRRCCDVFEHDFDYVKKPGHQYTPGEFASDFYNAQYCISGGVSKENIFRICGARIPERKTEIER